MRVVLDTNVLVSATLSQGNPYIILEHGEAGQIQLVTSPGIIAETRDVLMRGRIPFPEDQVDEFIEKVVDISLIVVPEVDLWVVDEDPDDDKILECAIASDADYIISGDTHLRNIEEFNEIRILSPAAFVEVLDATSGSPLSGT